MLKGPTKLENKLRLHLPELDQPAACSTRGRDDRYGRIRSPATATAVSHQTSNDAGHALGLLARIISKKTQLSQSFP